MSKSMFFGLLGDISVMKTLDFLIENYLFKYSFDELSKYLGFSDISATKSTIRKMEKVGLVTISKGEVRLNQDSEIVMKLMEIDGILVRQRFEKEGLEGG